MVIGLTGKYCAGKNAVSAVLEATGAAVIDVDKLGHQALAENSSKIVEAFGADIIDTDGSVNRRKLGAVVFSDPSMLAKLESISHPWMVEKTQQLISEYQADGIEHVIINAAILLHMKLHVLCSAVIWVNAPLLIRISRALKRDNMGLSAVLKRIWSQRSLKAQPLRKYVDTYTIRNSDGTDLLDSKVRTLLEEIEQKGRNGR